MNKLMRKFLLLIVVLCCSMACSDSNYFIQPKADFTLSATEIEVGELFFLNNVGIGDYFTVYTGEEDCDYDLKQAAVDSLDSDLFQSISGKTTNNDGDFQYSYENPGSYTLTYVATSYDADNSVVVKDIKQVEISVIERDFEVKKLSFTNNNNYTKLSVFTPQSYYSEAFVDNNNISCYIYRYAYFYTKPTFFPVYYGGVSDYQIKLNFDFGASSPDVEIEGNEDFVNNNTTVDLLNDGQDAFEPKKVTLLSKYSDASTTFNLCVMMIPDFLDFSVDTYKGKINFTVNQFTQQVTLTVPDSIDLSAVNPVFSVSDATHTTVRIDGVIQESGVSVVDLSSGEIIYALEFTQPEHPEFKANSEVKIIVQY